MTSTLLGTPDPNERPAEKPASFWDEFDRLDEEFKAIVGQVENEHSTDLRADLDQVEEVVQEIAPAVRRHDTGIPNSEGAHFVQPFDGPARDLDAGHELIAAKLEANAWGWAEQAAAEAGFENVAQLRLLAVGRKRMGHGWVNAATWVYARW